MHSSAFTYWLRVPEHMQYKLAVLMVYKVLHGVAPSYLGPLLRVADLPGRRVLRSAGSNRLVMLPVKLSTVGSLAFLVSADQLWNSLQSWRHRAGWFAVNLSAPTETLSVPAVLARCCTVTVVQLCVCYYDTLSGPSGGSNDLGNSVSV